MASSWVWDERVQRYRDPATGRFVSLKDAEILREIFMDKQKAKLAGYVTDYANDAITLQTYRDNVARTIKDTYIDMYAMGAGGRNNLTQADWGRIGAMVKEQYQYLDNLFLQIERGEITHAQALARLNMYINSANEALWKAHTRGLSFTLPAYPGDGSTQCLTNCKCSWKIEKVPGGYDCYWIVNLLAENCPDCIRRGVEWNPWSWREEVL